MNKKLIFALTIVLGLCGFCAVPLIVGIDPTLETIGKVGLLGSVLFCLNGLLMLVIPTIGWWLLMIEEGCKVGFLDLLKANVMGFPINFFTPSLYIGGEPIKTLYIAKTHNIESRLVLATVIVNKFQEIGGLLLFILISIGIIIFCSGALTLAQEVVIVVVAFIFLLAFAAMIYAFIGNFQPVVRLLKFLMRFKVLNKPISRIIDKAAELEVMVRNAFVKKWKVFIISQVVTLLSAVSIFMRPMIFYYFYGGEMISMSDMAIIFTLTQFINLFQIIPGNLGISEGGIIGFFKIIGRAEPEAVAFSILGRITELFMLVTGMWFIAHYGFSKFAKEQIEIGNAPPQSNNTPAGSPAKSPETAAKKD